MPYRPRNKIPPLTGSLTCQTGLDMNYPEKPFMINLARGNEIVQQTRWNLDAAKGIAAGLNKFIAIYEQRYTHLTTAQDPEKLFRSVIEAGTAKTLAPPAPAANPDAGRTTGQP